MAELKTQKNQASVAEFIEAQASETTRDDCRRLVAIMEEIAGAPATMWGGSIVGFGHYHYRYASGREGDWFLVGFSPRKQNLTLYIMAGFDAYESLLAQLGKHKTGKSCLYIKKLDDLHEPTLRELIRQSVASLQQQYPG